MKHRIIFKTPDVLFYAKEQCESDDEIELLEATTNKFIKYDEQITIEFDVVKQTATVVEL